MHRIVIVIELAVPGLDAPEIETAVTVPLERALSGLPGVVGTLSTSTWQRSRFELRYAGAPDPEDVEQVAAVVRAESARFDVAASEPIISIGLHK